MAAKKVTLTMDEEVLSKARQASKGKLSRFVSEAVRARLDAERREKLREDLIAGCIEDGGLNLDICREWDAIDQEAAGKEYNS